MMLAGDRAKWLESLCPGTKVVVRGRWGHERVAQVERVLPTQVVVQGVRYRKRTGQELGGAYSSLRPWSEGYEAHRAALQAHRTLVEDVLLAWRRLSRHALEAASDEALRDLRGLLVALGGHPDA